MKEDEVIAEWLALARRLDSTGQDEAAKSAYLELLRRDPTHFEALIELGNRALATGHRSAARTAYRQAVQCHPAKPVGHVNLGNLDYQEGELDAARLQYEAALALDGEFAEAHQGMARILDRLGDGAAARVHWRTDGHRGARLGSDLGLPPGPDRARARGVTLHGKVDRLAHKLPGRASVAHYLDRRAPSSSLNSAPSASRSGAMKRS